MYFGFCEGVKKMNIPNTTYMDIYDGYYAKFYDNIVRGDNYDVNIFSSLANQYGNEILELACGSGRVLIPLMKAGYNVEGVDLSQDMLSILLNKCKEINMTPKVYGGDMCTFKTSKKFDVVILSHISICLVENYEQLRTLFFNVYQNLLKEKGVFVFNFVDYSPKLFTSGELLPKYYFNPATKSYTILFEKVDLEEKKVYVNLYSEELNGDQVHRYIGTTCKNIISKDTIDGIVKETKFLLKREEKFSTKEGLIKFYMLEKNIEE